MASLGDEAPGVQPGPTHRPGQPCGYCHDGTDEARAFSMSGTVFATIDGKKPVSGALVTMTDSKDTSFVAETNCAGNFFVRPETWQPVFPVKTKVTWGAQTLEMESRIHREGSCAACHGLTASPSSAGPVFLWDGTAPDNVTGGCP